SCVSAPVSDSFFFSSRRRHTRFSRDWSSDVCSSDLDRPQGREEDGTQVDRPQGRQEDGAQEHAEDGAQERGEEDGPQDRSQEHSEEVGPKGLEEPGQEGGRQAPSYPDCRYDDST